MPPNEMFLFVSKEDENRKMYLIVQIFYLIVFVLFALFESMSYLGLIPLFPLLQLWDNVPELLLLLLQFSFKVFAPAGALFALAGSLEVKTSLATGDTSAF